MQEPRQLYGLGSLVKSIGKTVKKVIKSDLGKAALIGAAAFGIPGTQFGGLLGRASFGGPAMSIFGKQGGIGALFANPSIAAMKTQGAAKELLYTQMSLNLVNNYIADFVFAEEDNELVNLASQHAATLTTKTQEELNYIIANYSNKRAE